MKLICPVCQSKFSWERAAHEALLKEVIDLASKFGKNWELVSEYLDCFRQEQWGSVGLKKSVRLLKEVWGLFEKNEFSYQGKRYRTDWARINAAMRSVVNADKFGFKNHNYLKRVLMGEGAERVSAEGLTAHEEREREEKRRISHRPTQTDADEEITAIEHLKRHGLKSLGSD